MKILYFRVKKSISQKKYVNGTVNLVKLKYLLNPAKFGSNFQGVLIQPFCFSCWLF